MYLLHFVLFVYLAVAVVLAVIVDHTRSAIRQLGESTKRGFEWAHVAVAENVLLVEWSSRRAHGGGSGDGPTRRIRGEKLFQ